MIARLPFTTSLHNVILASGAFDGTIRLWDVMSGAERKQWTAHNGGVASLAISPDGVVTVVWPEGARTRRTTGATATSRVTPSHVYVREPSAAKLPSIAGEGREGSLRAASALVSYWF